VGNAFTAADPFEQRRSVTARPITSSAEYPKRRAAPGFQLVTMPSSVSVTIASSEDSTTAASRLRASSACLRSVMSSMMPMNCDAAPSAWRRSVTVVLAQTTRPFL
jgi:hypothetical protein